MFYLKQFSNHNINIIIYIFIVKLLTNTKLLTKNNLLIKILFHVKIDLA